MCGRRNARKKRPSKRKEKTSYRDVKCKAEGGGVMTRAGSVKEEVTVIGKMNFPYGE